MMQISKHITYNEATQSPTAIRLGIANHPDENHLKAMKLVAEKCFEPARIWWAKPIRINSFFRSFKLNMRIGGAANSQHMEGEAIDITTGSRADNAKLYAWMVSNLTFDQCIWEYGGIDGPDWIHVSYRAEGNRQQSFKLPK